MGDDAFNYAGVQHHHHRLDPSDPFSLFEGWASEPDPIDLFSDSSDQDSHHPFLFPPPYHHHDPNDVVSSHHHLLSPQSITELDGIIIHRQQQQQQQLLHLEPSSNHHHHNNQPITIHHAATTPDRSSSAALFDLLRSAGATNTHRNNNNNKTNNNKNNITIQTLPAPPEDHNNYPGKLSTEELLRIAGARFIQSSSKQDSSNNSSSNNNSVVSSNPFDLSFSGLADDELKNVELAEFLLTAAEKVGDGQFERASGLLVECDLQSSPDGDPVQRLVHYFSRALQEKIERETGKGVLFREPINMQEIMMPPRECFLEFYEKVPFGQVSEFAAIQAVVDSVSESRRIHIVDFNIKNGEQWTIFMQALVSREEEVRVEHLRVTAVGTMLRDVMEETGKRLVEFATTMAISFSFNLVMVDDYADLKEDMLDIDPDETVAVLSEYLLTTLISPAEKLDSVMRTIAGLNPCVMVVTEVESNHNSPVFVNRFIESLFYASAYFDCLETCMDRDSPHRRFVEHSFFGEGSRIIVATEGEERVIRNVKMDVWRAYFRRFGMEEADLSLSCLYQAELVAKKFPCWRYCTIGVDGKSLIVGWKGTPIHSVTAWKFNYE